MLCWERLADEDLDVVGQRRVDRGGLWLAHTQLQIRRQVGPLRGRPPGAAAHQEAERQERGGDDGPARLPLPPAPRQGDERTPDTRRDDRGEGDAEPNDSYVAQLADGQWHARGPLHAHPSLTSSA